MPAILDQLVTQLIRQGKEKQQAYRIATAVLRKSGNLKFGSFEATDKGKKRGKMSSAERAKDRASKYSGRPVSDYTYNSRTNHAVLKTGGKSRKG